MTKLQKLYSVAGAVSCNMSAGASVLYKVGSFANTSMSVANTVYSYVMPSYVAKTILMGQVGLGYEYIVPKVIRDFALNESISIEKAMIGDNNFTNSLNKVLKSYFEKSKFIASEFNSGMYQVAKIV